MTNFFKDTFFSVNLWTAATEIRRVSFLRIFFSLGKSALLHCRCLMLKFLKFWYWCIEKYFLLFIRFCMKRFPSYIRITSFLSSLVLSGRKHFCSILTNLSNLSLYRWNFFSSKVPFAKFWSEKCFHKRLSNAVVRKCSSN